MKDRMMQLAEKDYQYLGQSVNIMLHEGLNSGIKCSRCGNDAEQLRDHFYSHSSP